MSHPNIETAVLPKWRGAVCQLSAEHRGAAAKGLDGPWAKPQAGQKAWACQESGAWDQQRKPGEAAWAWGQAHVPRALAR